MNFKENVISLAVAILCVTVIASANVLAEHESNSNLISFMTRSADLMQRNPYRSQECFAYYIPLIAQITTNYQVNYEACVQDSRDRISQAEAATLEKRNDLVARANKSCELLSQCSLIASAENVFKCFVEAGSDNMKTMYGINANASDYLADLQQEFRLIEITEFKCTNETKRSYEKESDEAYKNLNNCILGISAVPPSSEAPVEPESPENPEAPENTETTEKLPEEDISLHKLLKYRFNSPRF